MLSLCRRTAALVLAVELGSRLTRDASMSCLASREASASKAGLEGSRGSRSPHAKRGMVSMRGIVSITVAKAFRENINDFADIVGRVMMFACV